MVSESLVSHSSNIRAARQSRDNLHLLQVPVVARFFVTPENQTESRDERQEAERTIGRTAR
jgi:hypothetical protein